MNIKKLTLKEKWDFLIETHTCTEEELDLVTCINGYNEHTINLIVCARTGFTSFEKFIEDIPF